MKLHEIDKARYRKHLNRVIIAIIFFMLMTSLSVSTALIVSFGMNYESHFWFNVAGVAVSAIFVVLLLLRYKSAPYMAEVSYVWDLKQVLNKIYRKQKKIEAAMELGNKEAMKIINFQLKGSKQLYQLDDNTITLDELGLKISRHDALMREAGLSTDVEELEVARLQQF